MEPEDKDYERNRLGGHWLMMRRVLRLYVRSFVLCVSDLMFVSVCVVC